MAPLAYGCYLCGAQFGSKSLFIHIKSCAAKFEQQEQLKPANARRPLPPPPSELAVLLDSADPSAGLPRDRAGVDAFNAIMSVRYNDAALQPCSHCGRTFNSTAFERHAKVCTAERPGGPLGMSKHGSLSATAKRSGGSLSAAPPASPSSPNGGGPAQRPRAYMCYLCGAQFGSASLSIHIPQCREMWIKREASEKAPAQRRAPPPQPPQLDEPLPKTAAGIDAFNEAMSQIFNGVSLVPCKHCGRTFRPEALQHHAKHCTADKPMAATAGGRQEPGTAPLHGSVHMGSEEAPSGEEERVNCSNCGRSFVPAAHAKHTAICAKVFGAKKVKA